MSEEEKALDPEIVTLFRSYAKKRERLHNRSTAMTESLCLAANVMYYRVSAAQVADRAKKTLKEVFENEGEIFASLLSTGIAIDGAIETKRVLKED